MKLEPIVNPHAKSGQGVQKKTKQEEKDDLIEKTKKTTIDKYGVGDITTDIICVNAIQYHILNLAS
jgi:hypothetical protein